MRFTPQNARNQLFIILTLSKTQTRVNKNHDQTDNTWILLNEVITGQFHLLLATIPTDTYCYSCNCTTIYYSKT